MIRAGIAATAFGLVLALTTATAAAAQTEQPPARQGSGMMGQGMMGPGMMGQGTMGPGMMGSGMMGCPMMSGGTMGRGMMPMLPPGNEKLQLQMQAEIMQKVGEIMAKYANQIQQRP